MFGKHKSGYFVFKGIPSYEYGILAEKLPSITRAARRVESVTVPGVDGVLHRDQGSYENIALTAECTVLDEKYMGNIGAWLQGYGKVIFGNEPEFYRYAMIYEAISFEELYRKIRTRPFRFPVVFDCNPIKYHVNEIDDALSIIKSGYVFRGKGALKAKPLITVYGSGTVTLTVNSTAITLTIEAGHLTLDCAVEDCFYDSGGVLVNANNKMVGNYPALLAEGQNTVSYSGSVSRIEIEPRWRWI